MFRKLCMTSLIFGGLAVFSACVVDGSDSGANAPIETKTTIAQDLDGTQKGAMGLIFGMPQIDDNLDVNTGDSEDWRYIIAIEPGMMTLKLSIDNPAQIDGGWSILDSEMRSKKGESFSKTERFHEIQFPMDRGVYYLRLFATSGQSVYTIAASFTPTAAAPVVAQTFEPEEEEDEKPVTTPSKPSKTHSSPKKPKGGTTTTEPKPDPKPEPAPEPAQKIVGYITIITPQSNGSTEITVRNVGKNKGIETGAVGQIEGTSIKVELTKCFATSCKAILPSSVDPKKLKENANVIFKK